MAKEDGMALPFEGFFNVSQLRRWLAAIPRRFSCRDYLAPAPAAEWAAMEYTAASVCLPGIRIALEREGAQDLIFPAPLFPQFKGLAQYAVILADKEAKDAALLGGISGQAFQLELVHQGLQGCWITGNYRRLVATASARPNENILAVMPFGQPRDPEGARKSRRRILTSFSPDDPTLWPYWAYHAAEAMRFAPSAVNRQPWRISFSGHTLRFEGKKRESIDTGIALMHLECALYELERAWRQSADNKSFLVQIKDEHEPV